jgi:CRISPR-associated protein Csb2
MPLTLEIEHLLGVAFAAQSPASSAPDWPTQPDRVFSALVAAWGARGEQAGERAALEWLEAQHPPEISASTGFARTPATVFVPPNDPLTGRVGDKNVMPTLRERKPRRFPAYRPDDPVVHLVWREATADSATMAALNALAADTPYVGHSASLTRCRFHAGDAPEQTVPARRRVYRGRLARLEADFQARPRRRPSPGETVRAPAPRKPEPQRSVFADRWLVLEHVGGDEMPDLRAAALVSKALRSALMSGYKKDGREAAIPPLVSGHAPDGAPLAEPHLAIAPLAFLGAEYADGHVYGFALIPPRDGDLLASEHFQDAVRAVATEWNKERGWRELALECGGFRLILTPSGENARASLDPRPYVAVARTWATCTPVVLDRHLKAKGNAERDAEVAGLLHQACVNVGLPGPERIASGKHSAVRGAPPAYPSGSMPRWMRWRLPESLASRQLTHAVLQFPEPVRGPVLLGAGRFAGLGLCRALDPEKMR